MSKNIDINSLRIKRHDPEEEAYEELINFADEILDSIDSDVALGPFMESEEFYNDRGTGVISNMDIREFSKILENPNMSHNFFKEDQNNKNITIFEENKNEENQYKEIKKLFTIGKNESIDKKSNDIFRQILIRTNKKKIKMTDRQKGIIRKLCEIYVIRKSDKTYRRKKRTITYKSKYKYRPGAKSLTSKVKTKTKPKSKRKTKTI